MEDTDFHKITEAERAQLISVIAHVLNRAEEIAFAYIYGAFVTKNLFRDIDICIHIIRDVEDPLTYAGSIQEMIFDATTNRGFETFIIDDFDVRVINESPYDFAINILCEGKLIVDKDPELRTDYIERISNEYRANSFILDEAYRNI